MVLPIPQQISDISAIDWTDGKMNPLEAYGLAATSTIIQKVVLVRLMLVKQQLIF